MYYALLAGMGLIMMGISALLMNSSPHLYRTIVVPCNDTVVKEPEVQRVQFTPRLNDLFQKSLDDPCNADLYIECWFGLGSKLNIFTYLMVDAMLANKTVSVWDNRKDPRRSQLAKMLKKNFDISALPVCSGDEHSGVFHNDGKNFKSNKKLNIPYEEYIVLLGQTMHYMFDNVKPAYRLLAENIVATIPRPFYTVHVRYGDKVGRESKKIELPVYVDTVRQEPTPAMIHMMTVDYGVTEAFRKQSSIRTVNYNEDILVEMLIASMADKFFGTETSNIYRVIYKIREGREMYNIEDTEHKRKHPIRVWLTKWKRRLRSLRLL